MLLTFISVQIWNKITTTTNVLLFKEEAADIVVVGHNKRHILDFLILAEHMTSACTNSWAAAVSLLDVKTYTISSLNNLGEP